MAANACFFCKAECDQFVNGWKLKDGSLAELCKKCGFAYVNGTFCETFHVEVEGWRDCAVCGKPLHCGCIMSCHKYAPLDLGGVGCAKCLLEVDQSIASGQMTRMLKELVAKDKTVSSDVTEKIVESLSPGSLQATAPQFGEASNRDASKGDTACETKVGSETPQVDASIRNHLHPENLPKTISAEQLQKISGNLNSDLIPLFEKSLTTSDAYHSTGRLVIPKKYAEDYFPKIHEAQGYPITIQDTIGKDWKLEFHCLEKSNSEEKYVLEGLTDYMVLMQWQAGDKVAFYRTNSEGLVIETRKAFTVPADRQEQSPRDIETGPTPVETSLKTDQEQSPRDMEKSLMPIETSQKSDQGQSPRDLETGPTPVETSLKTDQEQSPRDMETSPTPIETCQKTNQEQCPRTVETSLDTVQEQSARDMETSLKID